MPSGRKGQVPIGSNLLQAAQELGVELESICGGRQTCGKCQIIIEEGNFPKHGITSRSNHISDPSDLEREYDREHNLNGRRLACAAQVLGDILITVPEESQANKQIIAKAATERAIEVNPAVKQLYVEVEPAVLGDPRGDWERLAQALQDQWQLTELAIDPRALVTLQSILREGDFAVTVTIWQEKEVLRLQPGYQDGIYGLAVDVGSTTVVAHLCDLRTGSVLATQSAMNPQVRFGEDLMSRISYTNSEPQGLARMNRMIIQTLNGLAEKAAHEVELSPQDITDVVVVGNTVMHHILLGIDPTQLGVAPFALATYSALDLKARDLGLNLNNACRVHILPLIAGHVGADNVGVMLAESPADQDGISLIVDIGTNAEIILGDRTQTLVASSPTGPAFEGAQITHGQRAAPGAIDRVRIDPKTLEPRIKVIGHNDWIVPQNDSGVPPQIKATGICGSGIIEVIAELFLAGIINSKGHFIPSAAERSPRIQFNGPTGAYVLAEADCTATGSAIIITQNDVRAIQLAKAALYAGTKLLMDHRGVKQVDRIILAGAFGTFINPYHAMVLGLIPDCDLDHVVAIGNAAGDGARLALLNKNLRHKAVQLARSATYVETPLETTFQDEFVAALNIPHATHPFPHLAGSLPEFPEESTRKRRSHLRSGEYTNRISQQTIPIISTDDKIP
ncbi:MAG TPA: ASKHA domain-containing protein [Anaerolineales bacterium]|nr:ASKHA domain-containing protein [Anaerolineales bacterium]